LHAEAAGSCLLAGIAASSEQLIFPSVLNGLKWIIMIFPLSLPFRLQVVFDNRPLQRFFFLETVSGLFGLQQGSAISQAVDNLVRVYSSFTSMLCLSIIDMLVPNIQPQQASNQL
jgi:hypothetical protein